MTFQERILAELKDIEAVRLTCRCGASLNIPVLEREYVPEACPYCKEAWFGRGTSDHKFLTWLLQAIIGLKNRGQEVFCQIHLELNPTTKRPS
jgi:hypothetical protein